MHSYNELTQLQRYLWAYFPQICTEEGTRFDQEIMNVCPVTLGNLLE